MTEPQIIRTPGAEDLIVLSRTEYEALLARAAAVDEDAEDLAIYDARKAELPLPGDRPLPADLSALVLASDSFLQALRKWCGKTQVALAEVAGIGAAGCYHQARQSTALRLAPSGAPYPRLNRNSQGRLGDRG
jgi:hypothetical protein